jgi:hypothetical protein
MTQEVMKQLKVSQDEVSRLKALVIQYVHFCEDLDKFVIKQPVRSETLNQFKVLMSSGKEFNERNKAIIKQLTNNQASEQKGEG